MPDAEHDIIICSHLRHAQEQFLCRRNISEFQHLGLDRFVKMVRELFLLWIQDYSHLYRNIPKTNPREIEIECLQCSRQRSPVYQYSHLFLWIQKPYEQNLMKPHNN